MSNSIHGKWGYTHDEQTYHGCYDTPEEAAEEGALGDDDSEYETVTVGQYRSPEVLGYVDAELVLEHIRCQDDYCLDCADDALECTKEQKSELTTALQETVRLWLDKHNLWPKFGLVDEPLKITLKNSKDAQ